MPDYKNNLIWIYTIAKQTQMTTDFLTIWLASFYFLFVFVVYMLYHY